MANLACTKTMKISKLLCAGLSDIPCFQYLYTDIIASTKSISLGCNSRGELVKFVG